MCICAVVVVVVCLFLFIFIFKYAVLGTHTHLTSLGCLFRSVIIIFCCFAVNEREEGVVTLHLPMGV